MDTLMAEGKLEKHPGSLLMLYNIHLMMAFLLLKSLNKGGFNYQMDAYRVRLKSIKIKEIPLRKKKR